MKKEIRIIAWDDCSFSFKQKHVRVIGVVFRGGSFMDGLLSAMIEKDGSDATEVIANAILSSRHYDQLSYTMLKGLTLGGLNVVDIKELWKRTKLPVIVVQRKKPDTQEFMGALKKSGNYAKKRAAVKHAGKFFHYSDIFYQKSGLGVGDCEELLRITCTHSNVPEPLRVAHLIASGLSGESRGRA